MTNTRSRGAATAAVLRGTLALIASMALSGQAFPAQPTGVPEGCAGKTGTELDQCMRDATPSQPVVTPAHRAVVPAARSDLIVLCANVLQADKRLCVERNQAVLDCQKASRTPDAVKTCMIPVLDRLPRPAQANCAQEKNKSLAALCPVRNKYYKACAADLMNYFKCLEDRYAKK